MACNSISKQGLFVQPCCCAVSVIERQHRLLHLNVWCFEWISSVWFQTDFSLKGSCRLTPSIFLPVYTLIFSAWALIPSSSVLWVISTQLEFSFLNISLSWHSDGWAFTTASCECTCFVPEYKKTCLIAFDNKSKRLEQPYFQQYYSFEYH